MTDKRVPRGERLPCPDDLHESWSDPIRCPVCETSFVMPKAAPAVPDEPVPLSEWQQLVAERDALKAALRMVQELEAGQLPDEVFRAVDKALEMVEKDAP